ncbi:MAG: tRNA uridine-5-carboxymethylaminomethyl(34) synthesis GTPase MnmE [Spirochaetales bacterium]|nr:tRNA uridine-5-carboxymethylaminomethyl(34) synthesis GTPase MnmE [Spirochaetales bacterium]
MIAYSTEDPIVALASPSGESAIAVIRTSGTDSIARLAPLFKGTRDLTNASSHALHHGCIIDPSTLEKIDEILAAVFRGPSSYTGEDGVELYCHGSIPIIQRIIMLLTQHGFRKAGPGEFTLRAFLNKKMDLTQAEAVNEIIRAQTDKARAFALNRLSGSIRNRIDEIKKECVTLLAAIEVQIDYPDEEIEADSNLKKAVEKIANQCKKILATYATGKIIQDGISMVIAGSTNAGKSTLFNLLLREDRAIVSDIHGTTRDYIEGVISIEGIPVRLYDTAGLRDTDNPVEIEGIRRTDRLIENAHVLLYVIDAGCGMTGQSGRFIEAYQKKTHTIVIWNKTDVTSVPCPPGFIPFSAKTGNGLDELNELVVKTVIGTSPEMTGEPVIDSIRQKECLEKCLTSLGDFEKGLSDGLPLDVLAICLQDSIESLGTITGEVTSDDVLSEMFSHFCVGK